MNELLSPQYIRTNRIGRHIGLLTLNRPEARNAANAGLAAEVFEYLKMFEADPDLRVGIVTGAGPVFSAGADLKELAAGRDIRILRTGGFAGFTRFPRTKPWIACVQGPAYGGGAELTLSCDMVVMADHATLALTEVRHGLVALSGGVLLASRKLPSAIANEWILTGQPMTAQMAFHHGLINRLASVDRVLEEATMLAEQIAEVSPASVRISLAVARATATEPISEAWRINNEALYALYESPDYREGPRAFVEQREPRWKT